MWPCTVGSDKLLSQLNSELQGSTLTSACLLVWHDKFLPDVGVVDTELGAIVQDASVRTEGLPADTVVLHDVFCQVDPSHVVVVVLQ